MVVIVDIKARGKTLFVFVHELAVSRHVRRKYQLYDPLHS